VIENTDLGYVLWTGLIDQFENHSRTDERDRHWHKYDRLGNVAPAETVRQLRCQKTKTRRGSGDHGQPQHVIEHGFRELGFGKHFGVIFEPYKGARIAGESFLKTQNECRDHRVCKIQSQRQNRRSKENPWTDHISAVDVAPCLRATGRKQNLVEEYVCAVEISDAAPHADDDCDQSEHCWMHDPVPPKITKIWLKDRIRRPLLLEGPP
jgi:hypothetical protein